MRGGPRKINREDAPRAGNVANAQPPTVRLDPAATDGEPKTQTAPIVARLFEGLERRFNLSTRQAAAFVLDFEQDAVHCSAPSTSRDRRAAFCNNTGGAFRAEAFVRDATCYHVASGRLASRDVRGAKPRRIGERIVGSPATRVVPSV